MLGTSEAFRNLILTFAGEEDDEQQQDQAEDREDQTRQLVGSRLVFPLLFRLFAWREEKRD